MHKLIIHTGYFKSKHPGLEVIQLANMTPDQRMSVGRALRPSEYDSIRNVFVDDAYVFQGIQQAVKQGKLRPKEVLIMFDPNKLLEKHLIHILPTGEIDNIPNGFELHKK